MMEQGFRPDVARATDRTGGRAAATMARAACIAVLGLAIAACQPTVKVEAPDKPIVINLNVKIEQEVRIKIDRELDETFAENPDLFN